MGVLRLILALAVLEGHTKHILPFFIIPGSIAVQTFYIISGFYMGLILNDKYLNRQNGYSLFITNRFLRIFPAYVAVVLLTLLYYFIMQAGFGQNNPLTTLSRIFSQGHWLSGSLIILLNIIIFGQDIFYFVAHQMSTAVMLIPQGWTLSLELMFYLLAPFFLRVKCFYLVGIFFFSVFLRILLFKSGFDHDPWTYRFFPAELALFISGIFSFKLYQKIRQKDIPLYWNAFVFVLLVLLTVFLTRIHFPPLVKAIGYYTTVILGLPFCFYFLKDRRWDRVIGDFSYPVYVSHYLIKSIVLGCGLLGAADPNLGRWVALGAIVFSTFLLRWIIYPIDRMRERRVRSGH